MLCKDQQVLDIIYLKSTFYGSTETQRRNNLPKLVIPVISRESAF